MPPSRASVHATAQDFLAGGGDAGHLIRAFDWMSQALGPPEAWPQPLKTGVSLMLATGHPMCIAWGEELTFLYNDAYAPILTSRHPQALGRPIADVWADVWSDIAPLVGRALAGEAVWLEDMYLAMTRDGREEDTWWTFSYSPLRDESGVVRGFVNICNDVTGKVLNERRLTSEREALRESEREMRFALKAGRFGAWRLDLKTGELTTSETCRTNFGRDPQLPFTYAELHDAVHRDDRRRMAEAVERSVATGTDYDIEYRITTPSADVRWVAIRAQPTYAADGTPLGMAGVSIDITDRKQTEDALAASRATLQAVYDNTPVGLIVAELPSGRLAEGNRTLREIFRHATHRTESIDEYRIWESYDAAGQRTDADDYPLARSFATGKPAEGTYQFVRGDGTRAWLRVQTAPIRDASGAMTGGVVAVTDVDEMMRTREALERLTTGLEAEVAARTAELRQYQEIIEATTSPICAFDTSYRLIAFNKAHSDEFFRIFGRRVQRGEVLPDLFPPDQAPVMRGFMARALAGERYTVVEEFGDPNLVKPYWEVSYTPLRDPAGRVIGAFHLANDITARLRAEADLHAAQEALRQSQKMEAMGNFTGGVAHDFNNLLTPIVGSLDLLHRKQLGGDRERRLIEGALKAAERATTLVQRLLAFARRQPLQAEAVDVALLVEGMIELIGSTTGPRVRCDFAVASGLPPARADANQIELALLNLVVNARDAMPDGGRLTIAAAAEIVEQMHPARLAPGHYVLLSVADTGSGMDEATLARAAEPFFSTKGIGKGTGLGLSMVQGLTAQLGGGVVITSKPGLGTKVELWLPASAEAVRPSDLQHAEHAVARCGVVLLVDDEDLVRASTGDMLSDLGYDVVEAGSAEEAIRLIAGGLSLDLLVTDHLMPDMTGTDLIRSLRIERPGLSALIVSGYAEVEGIAPDLPRLVKPFRQADLAAAIAELTLAAAT